MTLSQFKTLNTEERYLTWASMSVEVDSYETFGFAFILYQLDNFYIEMRFPKGIPNLVVFIAFIDGSFLNHWLERIDISDIWEILY